MLLLRNRILLLIGGLAVAASLIILSVFVATDGERAAIQTEGDRSAELQSIGDDLASTLRDEQEAVSAVLLGGGPAAVERYAEAVRQEQVLVEEIRVSSTDRSRIAEAVVALTAANTAWRTDFAGPAIEAVARGTQNELASVGRAMIAAHEPVQAETAELITALDDVDLGLHARNVALNGARLIATALGVLFELVAAAISLWFVRRYSLKLELAAGRAGILNRFTEITTFAVDDAAVAEASLDALRLLVAPDAAVTHVLNRSKDRAIPEARYGDAIADVLPMHALSRCPGVIRGSIYVADDASAPLSVHCPVYPTDHGTVACVPLAHGTNVGAVHLFWDLPNALPLDARATVLRITEHAALAITNRRLLAALEGQANTDARTMLPNNRAFDRALERRIKGWHEGESFAVLMIDIDHFKDVNDRHGHPAGDEALRVFAGVLRSCMRDDDVAARYGGEEFAVLLPDIDSLGALAIAERIRSRTESTLIPLAPGVTERLTVSIGIALAPQQAMQRLTLLRVADDALYAAKADGRNRVAFLGGEPAESPDSPDTETRLTA